METLDKAIRCVQAEMRKDPEIDVSMATLRALTDSVYQARGLGMDQEEQAILFELFGQAALRINHAERLTDAILHRTNAGWEAEATVYFPEEDYDPEPLPKRRPDLFVIQGGRKTEDPLTPRRTNHLYLIHGEGQNLASESF